jgi:hypothetical protein
MSGGAVVKLFLHLKAESEKDKDPRNQDLRKVWESEEGLPKNSCVMLRFETNSSK